jgi:hypothetical protein
LPLVERDAGLVDAALDALAELCPDAAGALALDAAELWLLTLEPPHAASSAAQTRAAPKHSTRAALVGRVGLE